MFTEYLDFVANKWFNSKPRPFVEFAIKTIEKLWNEKNFFVIEAPTGYGKSTISATIALYSIEEEFKSIIAFPLRTLLEDQFHKFLKLGIAEKIIGKRYMHNPDSRYLIKPITLTTVDTLALNLFGIAPEDIEKVMSEKSLGHYFFSMFSVLFSNLMLDEVHLLADSTKSLSFLASLIKIAEGFDQKVILMSATLPEALKAKLREVSSSIEFIGFERALDKEFCDERLKKSYKIEIEQLSEDKKFEKILEWIKENRDFSRVLVIFNTVAEAIEFYEKLRAEGYRALLIHSRFTEKDREEKIRELRRIDGDYIIVATQAIEAGVDLSSNLLITDIAPASSLIQRFGRFLRYGEEKGKIFVWFEEMNGDFYKVYSKDLVEKTIDWLKKNANSMKVHLPFVENAKGYAEMLDSVYSSEDFKIDKEIVENFEKIYLHLENAPKKALEMLFESGGSFIRDGFQVPVSFAKERTNFKPSEFIKNCVVPVSFELFEKMVPLVSGAFKENGSIEFVSRENLKFLGHRIEVRKLFRAILQEKILAFAVDVSYDSNLGLRLEG
ncbi:MAG: CRISPR-associated helicase Cas3' [Archaeoglobales archaeon]|nr:CRISPR-associated helicase Cas3' [Archaeoglobales archaeon]